MNARSRQVHHRGSGRPALIGWLLLLWAVANFGPHLLIYLLFSQPYFALPPNLGWPVEIGLMALKLGLPLW